MELSSLSLLISEAFDKGVTNPDEAHTFICNNFEGDERAWNLERGLKERKGSCFILSIFLNAIIENLGYKTNVLFFDGDHHAVVCVEKNEVCNYYDCMNRCKNDEIFKHVKGKEIVQKKESLNLWYMFQEFYHLMEDEKDPDSIKEYAEKGIDVLNRYSKLHPDSSEAKVNISQFLLKLERNNEAEKVAREAVGINYNNSKAHYALALCLSRLRRYTEAMDEFHKVMELDPHNLKALTGIFLCGMFGR